MWLFRGAQSAVFYYAACTPCSEAAHQRRRKREAIRSRDAILDDLDPELDHELGRMRDDELVTEQPRPVRPIFKQPTAFATNAFWSEEIALGPGPPERKDRKKKNVACRPVSQRTLASPDGRVDPESVREVLRKLKGTPKKEKDRALRALSERWNRMRYHYQQREDEELWGIGADVKGSSVGLPVPRRAHTDSSARYESEDRRNRPDLRYPIVVQNPRTREETRWMLQPPPTAKVMAGKVSPSATPRRSLRTSPTIRARPPLFAILDEEDECSDRWSDASSTHTVDMAASSTFSLSQPELLNPPQNTAMDTPRRTTHSEFNAISQAVVASRARSSPHVSLPTRNPNPNFTNRNPEPESEFEPESRPTSQESVDSGKAFKVISPALDADGNKVRSIHLEYRPDHDPEGELRVPSYHKIPFRWSMDV